MTAHFRTFLLDITPELAAKLLKLNTNNRPPDQDRIATYADEMASGKWLLETDPMGISDKGVLLDGQHRLYAVIKSRTTITVNMMVGITSAAYWAEYDRRCSQKARAQKGTTAP